jgi:hypothetical protein
MIVHDHQVAELNRYLRKLMLVSWGGFAKGESVLSVSLRQSVELPEPLLQLVYSCFYGIFVLCM